METLLSKLQTQARAHPSNQTLRRLIPEIHALLNGVSLNVQDVKGKFDQVQHDLDILATGGYWEPSKEDEDSLHELKIRLGLLETFAYDTSSTTNGAMSIKSTSQLPTQASINSSKSASNLGPYDAIVQPPPLSAPLLPISTTTPTALPIELIEVLNQTFFLHLLVTDPQRVLPPGKSLVSMLSSPRAYVHTQDEQTAKLEERVKDIVHNAFWNEVLESLSSSSADKQLPRLRRLYQDLYEAVKPLLPGGHPIIDILSLPLSPTSVPLHSTVTHLRELLVALRERASPARDVHIDSLLQDLDKLNQHPSIEELARLVTNTIRSTLQLIEWMKDDLSQFVVGSMEEKDIKVMITQQAMLREKALILQLWPPSRIELAWKTWLEETDRSLYSGAETAQPPHRRWAYRLVQALATNAPITCPLPAIRSLGPGTASKQRPDPEEHPDYGLSQNSLPPPFFVTSPALLTVQNYLQALVITASLNSLVRLSNSSPSDNSASFTERIWTLLRSSIDEEPDAEDTKVVNLADEVVRVRRTCADDAHPCGPEEEARLRAAVDRTLQPRDPVFLLLQRRLMQALGAWLVGPPHPENVLSNGSVSAAPAPEHMQTGRERSGKRPLFHLGPDISKSVFVSWEKERGKPPTIKGFEDEVLTREKWEVFKKVGQMVDWTDRIWQDLVETGEIGGLPVEMTMPGKDKLSGADAHV